MCGAVTKIVVGLLTPFLFQLTTSQNTTRSLQRKPPKVFYQKGNDPGRSRTRDGILYPPISSGHFQWKKQNNFKFICFIYLFLCFAYIRVTLSFIINIFLVKQVGKKCSTLSYWCTNQEEPPLAVVLIVVLVPAVPTVNIDDVPVSIFQSRFCFSVSNHSCSDKSKMVNFTFCKFSWHRPLNLTPCHHFNPNSKLFEPKSLSSILKHACSIFAKQHSVRRDDLIYSANIR